MSTKLEAVVGLLAGRKVEPELIDELADPSSEASRFLEATRARSRALLGGPGFREHPGSAPRGRTRWVALAMLLIAILGLLAGLIWAVDRRLRGLEAELSARDFEARESIRRVEASLRRLAEPRPAPPSTPTAAIDRIEADLARLERADPAVQAVSNELLALRRELSATEKLGTRRAEELQASVHDVARILRLLLDRSRPPGPPIDPAAGHNPPRPPAHKVENRNVEP